MSILSSMRQEGMKQQNRWSCLPTSLAILLGEPNIDNIIKFLGHDGSEIVWKHLPDPMSRRAFHIQEMNMYAFSQGYCLSPVYPRIALRPHREAEMFEVLFPEEEFIGIIKNNIGILMGHATEHRHAWAWNNNLVIDPNGSQYTFDDLITKDYEIEQFWILGRLS